VTMRTRQMLRGMHCGDECVNILFHVRQPLGEGDVGSKHGMHVCICR
jgi:hypothetical protein